MIAQTGWAGPLEGDRVVDMDSMDQGGIKWGAEIAVNNCKPDWVVQDDTPVWWQDEKGQSNVSTTARLVWQQSGGDLIKIKLPADHPHYQKKATQFRDITPAIHFGNAFYDADNAVCPEKSTIRNVQTPEASTAPAIDPALVERMRLLLVDVAGLHGQIHQYQSRAKDILKALEPVDGDLLEANRLYDQWMDNNDQSYTDGLLAAIRRGRALERGEK